MRGAGGYGKVNRSKGRVMKRKKNIEEKEKIKRDTEESN